MPGMAAVFNKVCGEFQEFYGSGLIPREELAFVLRRLGIDEGIIDMVPSAQRARGQVHFETFVAWIVGSAGAEQPVCPKPSLREVQPERTHFDVVVIGAGPCGLRAAENAASSGKTVALLDPTETLTGAPTGVYSKCLRSAALEGAKTWQEVQEMVRRTVLSAQSQASRVLRSFKVTVLKAKGALVDENTVQVSMGKLDYQLTAEAVIIATGSTSNRFPPTNFSLPGVYDSDTITKLDRIPRRMVIQGAGIVSIEFALIFAKLGSHVTVIDAFPTLLPMLDSSLQEAVRGALEREKIELIMGVPLKRVVAEPCSTPQNPALRIETADRIFGCDTLLSACGRYANSGDLGLENLPELKISARGKLIEVDDNGYTGVGKIYAVGDVATGSMGLATMGQCQAERAVRALLGGGEAGNSPSVKPSAIWTIPELAWAGITEEEATKRGLDVGISKVGFKQTIKACVTDEDGFLKLIFDRKTGKTLGVHLFGEYASELVNYGAEAVNLGTTIFAMLRFVFPAVTYHNLYSRAAAEGKLRLTGVKNLEAATMWKQVYSAIEASLKQSGSSMTVTGAMKKAFKHFDKQKHGFLSREDLEAALVNLGLEMEEDDAWEMIYEATDGASEKLDYKTFLAVIAQNDDSFRAKLEEDRTEGEEVDWKRSVTPQTGAKRGTVALGNALDQRFKGSGQYDAIVLGAGPAGLKAAAEVGARGKKVVLVDPSPSIHGAPTGAHSKCLREAVLEGARTWAEVKDVLARAMGNAEYEAARLSATFQVKVMRGYGSVVDENTILCRDLEGKEEKLKTDAIIIATGSKSNRFPPVEYSMRGVYDSDTIQTLDHIPRKLVVQGAGIIGIEYALIFAKLGSEVTVVDAFAAWLPMLDICLQETIRKELDTHRVEIILGCPFKSVTAAPDSCDESPHLLIDLGDRSLECDTLLSACGRKGNIEGLNLEALAEKGLKVNPRGKLIEVDGHGYTGCAKVYAVGDCATGSMGLATMGQQQAVLAARALFSKSGMMKTEKVVEHKPCAVWTIPEVAWAGLTEEQARKKGIDFGSASVHFTQTLKGCISMEEGYLKLIFDRSSGCVLGCHLFGESSCELVNYGAEIVNEGVTIQRLLHFVFPAVTYHQLYHQAAAEAKLRFRGALDLASCTQWSQLQSQLSLDFKGSGKSVKDELNAAFRRFDDDNSGFLSHAQLSAALTSLGLSLSQESVQALALEASGDITSEMDYQNLITMLSNPSRGKDPLAPPDTSQVAQRGSVM